MRAARLAVAATILATVTSALAAPRSAGERAYQKCYACHATERGKNDLEGPSLHGIIGRRVAAVRGFEYSRGMRAYARKHPQWSERLLDRYIADPEAAIPGTRMNFPGMRDAKERKALLEYLKKLR
ncbi:MAG TPA: c-type cytochrome [Sphingomicrobium sp.]|nr:c-type cytochrome [Sphingomicrobium sp.]